MFGNQIVVQPTTGNLVEPCCVAGCKNRASHEVSYDLGNVSVTLRCCGQDGCRTETLNRVSTGIATTEPAQQECAAAA